jgi:PAS domain S-box-containing protein
MGLSREAAGLPKGTMKTTSSHPDRDNPRGAVVSSAAKATTQPKKGAPEKREHCSPSLIEDATDGVMEDAKRKGAEERICFQARLVDAVGQAVIATDPQGKVIYWNRAAEELCGWSEEETIGRSIMEVTLSEEMLERAEEIMMELRAGKSWSGEFEVRRKDGTIFPAMATDTPVHDEEGNLVAIIGVSTDITELKQSEELRRSEERFRLLVEGVKDYAIFMLDPEERITSWNAGAERIKG